MHISCSASLSNIFYVIKNIMNIIMIISPILVIISFSIVLIKMTFSPEDKKLIKRLSNILKALIIIFLIPTFLSIVMYALGESNDISKCYLNSSKFDSNSSYIDSMAKDKTSILYNPRDYEKGEDISTNACLKMGKKNKVLFFGNSKTVGPNGGEVIRDNNVAVKFEGIAKSMGYDVEVTTIDEGLGYQSSRLNAYYDCYVDQQCTNCMKSSDSVASALSSRANILKKSNPKIVIYLRQIWTYCSGGQINNNGLNEAFAGAEGAAKKTGATLIPDGKAFLSNKSTGINICDDDRHQNNKGAYLVGAITFKMLSGKSPVGATYYADINSSTAKKLLEVANNTK